MDKFYVTFGNLQVVTTAKNAVDACIKTFRKWAKDDHHSDTLTPPVYFRVSPKGFDRHHDDKEIPTSKVLRIIDESRDQT